MQSPASLGAGAPTPRGVSSCGGGRVDLGPGSGWALGRLAAGKRPGFADHCKTHRLRGGADPSASTTQGTWGGCCRLERVSRVKLLRGWVMQCPASLGARASTLRGVSPPVAGSERSGTREWAWRGWPLGHDRVLHSTAKPTGHEAESGSVGNSQLPPPTGVP